MANTLAPLKLSDAKWHLKLDDDDPQEDSYLSVLIGAAEEYCEGIIHRDLDSLYVEQGQMPRAIIDFIWVVAAEMHKQRSLTSDRPVHVNPFYERLIDKYIDYSKGV